MEQRPPGRPSPALAESPGGEKRPRSPSIVPALRAVIEQSVQATCICDHDGRVLAINEAMAELLGLQREDLSSSYSILEGATLTAQELLPHLRKALGGTAVITPPLGYGPGPAGSCRSACCWMQAYLSPL